MKYLILPGLAALVLWLSCSEENPAKPPLASTYTETSALDTTLKLVSFNMAVGFDAEAMLSQVLTNPRVVLTEGNKLYDEFLKSKPRERMRILADSLVHSAPDVIALQEVLHLANRQDGQTYDFLTLLLSAMDSLGGPHYLSLRQVLNPIPIKLTVSDAQGTDSVDIYFYEGNALLYKASVLSLLSSDSTVFFFGVKNQAYVYGTTFSILRGALMAKFRTARGTLLSVATTHLEVEGIPSIGTGQAMELRDWLNTEQPGGGAIAVMGDFNGTPGGARVGPLLGENYVDTYTGSGFSCCYDIVDTTVPQTRRIDYILARGIVGASGDVGLNGTFIVDTTAYRISDHSGMTASLTFH